jgi:hypothetical protein
MKHMSQSGDDTTHDNSAVISDNDTHILNSNSSSNISEDCSNITSNNYDMKSSHMSHSGNDKNVIVIDNNDFVSSCSSSIFSHNCIDDITNHNTNDIDNNKDNNDNYKVDYENNNGNKKTLLPIKINKEINEFKIKFDTIRACVTIFICTAMIFIIGGIKYRESNSSIYDSIYRYIYILTYMGMNMYMYVYICVNM